MRPFPIFPASRKRRGLRWRRRACARPWYGFRHRCTETAITASFRASLPSRVKRAFRHTWGTGSITGLQCTGWMPLVSTGWRSKRVPPASRYHGVADEGVLFRDIARVIGRHLNVPVVSKSPEEAADHFGWISHFAGIDCPASSAQTQEQLGWRPTHPALIAESAAAAYFEAATETPYLWREANERA